MCSALLLSLSLLGSFVGVAGEPSPDGAFKAAVLDLNESVAPADRPYTRYLALWTIPVADRESFLKALAFWCNSTSQQRNFGQLTVVQGGQLVRLDLRAFGWDYGSRLEQLDNAQKAGATFTFKDEVEKRRFLDVWELVAQKDSYFFATYVDAYGKVTRGWLDPQVEEVARYLSKSGRPVLRADWFLRQLSFERPFGNYSDMLMLPAKDADLFKVLGADQAYIDRERLAQGGATKKSIVALRNRELQKFPTLIGGTTPFLWRSLDVKTAIAEQSVIEAFVGSLKADGKEFIFSLRNGLHGYYLCNGAGVQVSEVPIEIAQDREDPYDSRVINAYKCVSCHGQTEGIRPFKDIVSELAVAKGAAIAAVSKDKEQANRQQQIAEAYYLSGLANSVTQQQAAYAERINAVNGLKSQVNSEAYVGFVNGYHWGSINLDRAAIELGYPRDQLVLLLKLSANKQAIALANGVTLSREEFEDRNNFGAMARAAKYAWEK